NAAAPFTNDIDLVTSGVALRLDQAVNAGNATVRLNSGGTVFQTAGGAGSVTANSLAVVAAGNVDLCQVANSVGTFAASDTGPGGFVRLLDNISLIVGSVGSDACASGASGVTTTNNAAAPFTNDIDLVTKGVSLRLDQAVNAGSATVRLNSGGTVFQTAGGAGSVTANS